MDKSELKKAGLKVTGPRMKILKLLEDSAYDNKHLSAEEVYRMLSEEGEEVGLATVYRVLTQFETAGLVTRLNFESGTAIYELNDGQHHDHIVCVKCNAVREFIDETIESRQMAIALENNFQMTDHSLVIYGLCQECQTSQ